MRPLDTSTEVYRHQIERWRRMTGPERVAAARDLRASALAQFRAGVRARHPGYGEEDVHRAVMRRILGDDLCRKVFPGRPLVDL